ncbi:glycosyltransferase [Nocardioides sp. R-C-SC26]|uniref:tetratricopeptide repeat-containing glycosyltransferase n=1 Tax=Nocardioides sp. R-C-SC26 TaxID=2870414 RepID=UPI001E587771|nr:glycosyltransferase [Nocardioides sp. R-C-SC26]
MPGIGLMMIVKNEAHVIERCLRSVRPFIDWWVIADTGSTDGTQDLVRACLAGVPGEVVERPWVNFGHNRQEVLDLARASSNAGDDDYVLWIDADEQLVDVPDALPELGHDGYFLSVTYGTTTYARLALVRLDRPWRWEGPIHEYLALESASHGTLTSPGVLVTHDGARAHDPDTYRKDAALIEDALREDSDNPRLQFYLAQSWRDAGEPERALAAYAIRIANPRGWDQERYCALFETARLLEGLQRPVTEVLDAFLAAHQACPWRAEPLIELARIERLRERYSVALLYARPATKLPLPGGEALFVDSEAYSWRAWDELAISSYWTGRYADGAIAAQKALKVRPDDDRLRANLAWCQDKLTS